MKHAEAIVVVAAFAFLSGCVAQQADLKQTERSCSSASSSRMTSFLRPGPDRARKYPLCAIRNCLSYGANWRRLCI